MRSLVTVRLRNVSDAHKTVAKYHGIVEFRSEQFFIVQTLNDSRKKLLWVPRWSLIPCSTHKGS